MTTQATQDRTIQRALRIIEGRLQKTGVLIAGPSDAATYFVLRLAARKAECFAVMFLTVRHQLIEYREMFFGTIDGASVYPREVVRAVIETNAAAIVIAHNHPSGIAQPSDADRSITMRLQKALALIDVSILDHIIVAGTKTASMGQMGLL